MGRRYFSTTPITDDDVELTDAEAHHLMHVMRAKQGDEVILFDGSGSEFTAIVTTMGRRSVQLKVRERHDVQRESSRKLTVGVALPKGDRQRFLCEKLVEVGVHRLVPLATHRAVAQPSPSALRRLERSVVEASKQCGRNLLMEVTPSRSLTEFLTMASASAGRWIAHPIPQGRSLVSSMNKAGALDHAFVAIGPEGGFTEDEIHEAELAGWHAVHLSARILRIETAALVASVTILQET